MLLVIETITWKPHIETAMEVALQRRALGEDVVYCNLRDGLPIREDDSAIHALVNLPSIRQKRASAVLHSHGVRWSSQTYVRDELRRGCLEARELLSKVRTTSDFVALKYEEFFDIGWAALSSAISMRRNSTLSYERNPHMLSRLLIAAIMVYEKTRHLITVLRPHTVLVFNGRFATTRAAMRASESMGVPFLIHERGCDKDHYSLTDCLPHDLDLFQRRVIANWNPKMLEEGHRFFLDRRNRVERGWHSFTTSQVHGRLPHWMSNQYDWVTFFTSSDDEMVAMGEEYRHPAYPTQFAAIEKLSEALNHLPKARLCVRVHPHVAKKARADRKRWSHPLAEGMCLVGPDEEVDSYALMEKSKAIVTYGSTVGIEATYWGTPSMLLGRSAYDRLDVCFVPSSEDEIKLFLDEPRIFPREKALPYGAYVATFGERYQYYEAETLHRGKIAGMYLDDNILMKAVGGVRAALK